MLLRQLFNRYSTKTVFGGFQKFNSINSFPDAFIPGNRRGNFTSNRPYSLNYKSVDKADSLTEQDFLVKAKNDPDVFGNADFTENEEEEGDNKGHEFRQKKPVASQKLTTSQYANQIKSLINKHKIKEAIDFLEIRMIKEDNVKPVNYIYNMLISACGRVGYTKKAFSLYNDMKRRALKITSGTYTGLFNACSNSPWPTTDGLSRAQHLRGIMIEKLYLPNVSNYNAMIKAFGRGGDLTTAFALVDEMAAKRIVIKSDTLNFILQACITDKEAGFRHALLVWRKFIQKGVEPCVFSYNLMLRCIRDCGLGDIEITKDVINKLLPSNEKEVVLYDSKAQMLERHENVDSCLTTNTPNLMAKVPHLGSILSLSEVTKPEHRLLLVGGCKEFLQNMADNKCKPDIKTFTQLLDNMPSTLSSETELIKDMKKQNIRADINFYNTLIKKRSMRFDYQSAKDVLSIMLAADHRPDLITYGVLSLGCKTKEDAISLIEEMSKYNYRLNIEILGAMLHQACHHVNFTYVLHILELCIAQEIKPGTKFLNMLDEFKKKCRYISNNEDHELSSSPKFQQGHKIFRMRYKTWLEEIQIDESETVHPWQQYRENSETNTRHYIDKQAKTRFKPLRTDLFRKQQTNPNVKKYNFN